MANNISLLATTNANLKKMLIDDEKALPKGFNSLRFKQNALSVLMDLDLSKMQGKEFELAKCVLKGAFLGLDFMNKECYIIPYGGVPQFMTSYLGAKKLCYNYSVRPINNIYAQLVHDGDTFEPEIKDNKTFINFTPKPFSDGKIIGVFAVVEYKDGTVNMETMSIKEVEETRQNFSKQSQGKAWKNSYGEMTKKTILHRLCKHIQLDFNNIEQQQAWNNSGDGDLKKTFEATKTDVEDQVKETIQEPVETMSFEDTEFEEVNTCLRAATCSA